MPAAREGLDKAVCVVGAGAAGLITAHTLVRDGFKDVVVLEKGGEIGECLNELTSIASI